MILPLPSNIAFFVKARFLIAFRIAFFASSNVSNAAKVVIKSAFVKHSSGKDVLIDNTHNFFIVISPFVLYFFIINTEFLSIGYGC